MLQMSVESNYTFNKQLIFISHKSTCTLSVFSCVESKEPGYDEAHLCHTCYFNKRPTQCTVLQLCEM